VTPLLPQHTRFFADPLSGGGSGLLVLTSLPIAEVRGQPFLSTYLPEFHEAPFNPAVFWVLVNLVFWVFWISLMLGLTNILPMLPLDGGHVFRDVAASVMERLRPGLDPALRERYVGWTAGTMSILILVTFLLQIFGPHLVR
jgi:membrane-associated protease RseP (regulator of RpoE activity)